MNYTIRPAGPEDTAGITALRRMPGVFEQAASLPSDLTVESNLRRRHSGGLGIMVRTDCQGQGIGTALLEAVLDLADNWLMLRRVELEVYADNQRAVRLYEKFGFETEGRKREASVKNGAYVDLLVMARLRTP
ncbi:GNAT family N-acetyltransferase [Flavonifractor sp. An10]|uniref:GNAT family N-acetyltransferase n=1 Tax=Flavonifractor sp. An10 TaxID=1965537 RepID=UPI000B37387F|nr:GNAT family N-acetyltransferase [Flavonifractor sp. An10]OUQ80105.1 GNAT family N-acetyltransferase [Flavonifractor sp. An10]